MNTKPIIFNGKMVHAIQDRRKTETRRVITPQPSKRWPDYFAKPDVRYFQYDGTEVKCPYGLPGDLLWVRETARGQCYGGAKNKPPDWIELTYRADESRGHFERSDFGPYRLTGRWTPSIFMPRWASRITLRVTDVRVERVQDISQKGAVAEGFPFNTHLAYINWFKTLWDSINVKRGFGWSINPWVWVVGFEIFT